MRGNAAKPLKFRYPTATDPLPLDRQLGLQAHSTLFRRAWPSSNRAA